MELDDRGTVDVTKVPSAAFAVVEYFLDHLSNADQTCALASVQYFDEPLFTYLSNAIRTEGPVRTSASANLVQMSKFVNSFYVKDVGDGGYRTDGPLTHAVRNSPQREIRKNKALTDATMHLFLSSADRGGERSARLSRFFHSLVLAWQSTDAVPKSDAERLIDIGYNLFDAGYGSHLSRLPVVEEVRNQHPARLTAEYFSALTASLMVGPREALNRLESLAPMFEDMGRHTLSFDIEVAYLKEICGDYVSARERFRMLSMKALPFDGSRRDHVRAQLYYGDMLIMDGHFSEANELLRQTCEDVGTRNSSDWTELLRHRGHAYRFSLEFQTAEEFYRQALDAAGGAPNLRGELLTNLAETTCWYRPEEGIETAQEAIDLNERLRNRIEVVKALAARGVAQALLGDFRDARTSCLAALDESRSVDYPAGECFANQALAVVEAQADESDAAGAAYKRLEDRVMSLGTYWHLLVVPAWLRSDGTNFIRYSREAHWIAPGSLEDRLYNFITPC